MKTIKKGSLLFVVLTFLAVSSNGQKAPTGNPEDFKVSTCLHSVSYSGIWRGQALLTVDEFLVKAKELGLELVCIAGYNDFTAGVDKSGVPNVEIQAIYIGELARLARDLGTNMLRIYIGYERPGIDYDKQYAMVVESLQMAGKIASQYGVTLIVQNHHDIAVHHDAMKWLLDEVNLPNVKAVFDCWSPVNILIPNVLTKYFNLILLTFNP